MKGEKSRVRPVLLLSTARNQQEKQKISFGFILRSRTAAKEEEARSQSEPKTTPSDLPPFLPSLPSPLPAHSPRPNGHLELTPEKSER